jgi:hypothetical protein
MSDILLFAVVTIALCAWDVVGMKCYGVPRSEEQKP